MEIDLSNRGSPSQVSMQDFIAAPALHLETGNISALKLSKFYKDRGNLNWSFLLHLYDTTLTKVNPETTKVFSPELQSRIITECKRNPWYFFREWCRIPVPGGSVRFEFNRGNVAQLWCCLNSVNFIEMLPRQQGKTQGVIAAINYLEIFVLSNAEITFSNKLLNDSRLNVSRFKNQRELLPAWMRKYDPKKDVNNVDKLFMSVGKNTIKTLSTAKSVNDAERLGRGLTTPIVWFDESKKQAPLIGSTKTFQ